MVLKTLNTGKKMPNCQKCEEKISFFTIRDKKYPNPLGTGYLCRKCYQPYGLVLKKYKTNLKKIDSDPKAAAWVALCCLLAARRINLMRTITAAISGFVEKQSSWKVCKESSMILAAKAMSMLSRDSDGHLFLKALYANAKDITKPPTREIPIQRYASVFEDRILDIEYEAVVQSGVHIDEVCRFASSLPRHQWLLPESCIDNLESIKQI
ncbi:MAG: hypothetical protein OEM06_05605 [Desulfobacteraceae bacterium]|nr:hypothetical protein [Desulfobacteraceae bacterium]MDH3573666.1 hypothetical protein [Desulfobacteraceae bacterium]MDH3873765.1 hypothetical protein [Desulfobacteraceae bacterium]PLX54138.1 MAG: hypothetical protein C0611_01560 [Desulfobacteraceae bacterium]